MTTAAVIITCLRCGRGTDNWVTVLWQQERNRDGKVETVRSDALAILCPGCAEDVQGAVCAAVDAATS